MSDKANKDAPPPAPVEPAPVEPEPVVVDINVAKRLSNEEYESERKLIAETYGQNTAEAIGLRDQALAKLFARSHWTQEELAKREGKSQQWIQYRLRFGRFLAFTTDVVNGIKPPANLTEGRFRSFWEQTDKFGGNDRQRFIAVARLIESQTGLATTHKKNVATGKAIAAKCADGKWHEIEAIVSASGTPIDEALIVLRTMRSTHGSFGCNAEHRLYGRTEQYRIFRRGRTIDLDRLLKEVAPLLDELDAQGKKNMATMSPGTVAHLAFTLRKKIEELSAQERPAKPTDIG